MAEVSAVNYLLNGLRNELGAHCVKHNDLTAGVADVSAANGFDTQWIEVKEKGEWPKRPSTRVKWDHYTELQALFLRKRGGWLFVRIGRTYLLFDHLAAWDLWEAGGWPIDEMYHRASDWWVGRVEWKALEGQLWG